MNYQYQQFHSPMMGVVFMKINSIVLQNFKGCKNATYTFDGKNVTVCGANGSGKTTIFDAFTWLLFGKDSLDNAKFEIRPLDKDGKQIDNVEICVAATLDIDGKEVELKKTQKQNWVKKRGTQNPVLQGNVNEYEIDGYPRSEKDYKEYINGIVSDDLFKMLTNPTYFPNMPWKDQRATIMKFASDVSDVELATEDSRFAGLLPEIEKAPSTDDIKAKYTKSLNELKKKQVELPVRIDEISNSKVDIDVAELELLKNSLIEQIADVKSKIADTDKQFEECQKLSDGIMELKFAESDLVRKANEDNIKLRREIEDKIADKKFLVRQTEKTISDIKYDISVKEEAIISNEAYIGDLRNQYKIAYDRKFDENSLVCSYCGQEYPTDKKERLRAEFESHKAKELKAITDNGNLIKGRLDKEKETIESLEKELVEHRKSLEMLNNAITDLEKQLSELPTSIDISETDEYKAIQSQIAEKEQAMSQMNNASSIRESLEAEVEDLHIEYTEVEKQIAMSQKNVEIDERIAELQEEQRSTAQKIADVEKMLYLLDEFIKYKLDKISDSINAMFDGVNWKLFSEQINGGIKEVCECTVNGVPYGSLNNGHRIIAGLQIIKALQKLYGAYLPIFTDNAESVNDFNLPDMDCQLIKLKVSDDKELKVEVE